MSFLVSCCRSAQPVGSISQLHTGLRSNLRQLFPDGQCMTPWGNEGTVQKTGVDGRMMGLNGTIRRTSLMPNQCQQEPVPLPPDKKSQHQTAELRDRLQGKSGTENAIRGLAAAAKHREESCTDHGRGGLGRKTRRNMERANSLCPSWSQSPRDSTRPPRS
ncbi:hypothetical protein VTK73DRAFT_7344 [Phialemonium thermophilum]|uniref:Uncharacterized protein n=1 Tax=Phialemonium thermophilum TaxID=223376 RepID=A0ABR3WF37_9PEZI